MLASSTSCCFPRGACAFLAWAPSRHSLLRSNSLRTSLNRRTSLQGRGREEAVAKPSFSTSNPVTFQMQSRKPSLSCKKRKDSSSTKQSNSEKNRRVYSLFHKGLQLGLHQLHGLDQLLRWKQKKKESDYSIRAGRDDGQEVKRSGRLTPCPSKMVESVVENFSKHPWQER